MTKSSAVIISAKCLAEVDKIIKAAEDSCVAYIDIDGTIITDDGDSNPHVINLMEYLHSKQVRIYLWSAGGEDNCRVIAKRFGLDYMIKDYLPKPTISIDDMNYEDYVFLKLHPRDLESK